MPPWNVDLPPLLFPTLKTLQYDSTLQLVAKQSKELLTGQLTVWLCVQFLDYCQLSLSCQHCCLRTSLLWQLWSRCEIGSLNPLLSRVVILSLTSPEYYPWLTYLPTIRLYSLTTRGIIKHSSSCLSSSLPLPFLYRSNKHMPTHTHIEVYTNTHKHAPKYLALSMLYSHCSLILLHVSLLQTMTWKWQV